MPAADVQRRGGLSRHLPRHEVHVWHAGLSTQAEGWLGVAMATLSEDERARHARYIRSEDASLFVLARAMLRDVLGHYAGVPAEMLSFDLGPFGKPGLAPSHQLPFRFNVTHSNGVAMVAVTMERDVGIDLEAIRPVHELEALVERTFSVAEQRGILAAPDRLAAFFATWARKEAVVKALGRGIGFPLDAFDVEVGPDAAPAILASRDVVLRGSDWIMHDLPKVAGFASALAVERADDSTVVFREWMRAP